MTRWDVQNLNEAKNADLVCAHGVRVKVSQSGERWLLQSHDHSVDIVGPILAAFMLNVYGVLPRGEYQSRVDDAARERVMEQTDWSDVPVGDASDVF